MRGRVMKLRHPSRAIAATIAALCMVPGASRAADLFSDNFDTNTSSIYTVTGDPDTLVTFNYDYSTMGIPASRPGGTTLGVMFKANYGDQTAAAAATNISPTGKSFTGDYKLRFDVYLNANGPFPDGGTGSTQFITAGVGTAGNTVHKASGNADGAWFAVDNEGNSGIDFRAHRGTALEGATSTAYTATDDAAGGFNRRDANNPYYHTKFPGGQGAPQYQKDNYAQQTGALKAGAIGFGWHDVEITKTGNTVSWTIDGLSIATLTNASLPGNNVFVGLWDPFSSISDKPDLTFGVIDNLVVSAVPEPAGVTALALGGLVLAGRRRRTA